MALELEEVRRRINVDEPDYQLLAANLGPEAVPLLRALVEDVDPAVASKAAYILSLIPSPESLEGLEVAAQSADDNVRLAAAAALRNVAAPAEAVLRTLLADPDPGVRKVALRSAKPDARRALRAELQEMASRDAEEPLRRLAEEVLRDLD